VGQAGLIRRTEVVDDEDRARDRSCGYREKGRRASDGRSGARVDRARI
jgi:hypothetical protein